LSKSNQAGAETRPKIATPAGSTASRGSARASSTQPKSSSAPASRAQGRYTAPPQRSGMPVWLLAGLLLLLLAVLGGILINSLPSQPSSDDSTTGATGSSDAGDGVTAYTGLTRGHRTGTITYLQTPPVGGDHNPVWQNCGVYSQPVKNENAVHSMEHGAIWITYRPDLSADQVQTLRGITAQSGYRLLSPYPGLPSAIVATAWGYQLKLDNAGDPRLLTFIQKYEQQGPEPGAACSGGVGQPLGG
jgi:hypothetical protein